MLTIQLLVGLTGCHNRTGEVDLPIETHTLENSDTDRSNVETDESSVSIPAEVRAHIEPIAPRWDEDLRCVVEGLPEGWTAAVAWLRSGEPHTGAVDRTVWEDDLVPHLAQAGGEQWGCQVVVFDPARYAVGSVESEVVTISPPLPMVHVRAGGPFRISFASNAEARLSRPYLIGVYELREGDLEGLGGERDPRGAVSGPEYAAEMNWHLSAHFANRLSMLDGLEPCYSCTGEGLERRCEVPIDPYSCEGYRLPTQAEWAWAAYGAGAHDGMLPAGGGFVLNSDDCRTPDVFDGPADSTVADQCWYACSPNITRNSQLVGQLKPGAIGAFDMCGNLEEWTTDQGTGGEWPAGFSGALDPRPASQGGVPSSMYLRGGSVEFMQHGMDILRWRTTTATSYRLLTARYVRTLPPMGDP